MYSIRTYRTSDFRNSDHRQLQKSHSFISSSSKKKKKKKNKTDQFCIFTHFMKVANIKNFGGISVKQSCHTNHTLLKHDNFGKINIWLFSPLQLMLTEMRKPKTTYMNETWTEININSDIINRNQASPGRVRNCICGKK